MAVSIRRMTIKMPRAGYIFGGDALGVVGGEGLQARMH